MWFWLLRCCPLTAVLCSTTTNKKPKPATYSSCVYACLCMRMSVGPFDQIARLRPYGQCRRRQVGSQPVWCLPLGLRPLEPQDHPGSVSDGILVLCCIQDCFRKAHVEGFAAAGPQPSRRPRGDWQTPPVITPGPTPNARRPKGQSQTCHALPVERAPLRGPSPRLWLGLWLGLWLDLGLKFWLGPCG